MNIKDSQTEIKAKLTNIEVLDPDSGTLYPRVSRSLISCVRSPRSVLLYRIKCNVIE